jgi:hypothetical protein
MVLQQLGLEVTKASYVAECRPQPGAFDRLKLGLWLRGFPNPAR